MDSLAKEKQIEKKNNDGIKGIPDIEIFSPEPVTISIGGYNSIEKRNYDIYPLSLRYMKLFYRVQDLVLTDPKSIDEAVDIYSKLLNEKDTEYLEGALDQSSMGRIFNAVLKVNNLGIPAEKKTERNVI